MTQRTTATDQDLDWLLDGLVEKVPGTRHAVVLSDDGMVVSQSGTLDRPDAERLAAVDPQIERAIEQLVAGRSFSATLVGLKDGCAELSITATGSASGAGRQSTNLTIGGGQGVAVRIVSENGSTHATIGPVS